MKLTGKALELYKEWCNENVYMVYNGCPESVENALIIDWFDSVGIYIEIGGIECKHLYYWYNIQEYNTINGCNGIKYNSRTEATNAAIEKANELYNLNNK